MNEEELISLCRIGDANARKLLYTRTVNEVYRLVLRITGNEHDALDLTQNTYLLAFERIHQFKQNAAFSSWLYRIAYNEALQFLKASSRRTERTAAIDPPANDTESEVRLDTGLDLESAMAMLPVDDRGLLLLRYHAGLDYNAIADVLACPPGTVASRLNRARSRLAGVLEASYKCSEKK